MLRFNHDLNTWECFTARAHDDCQWLSITPNEARELFDAGCRIAV